MADAPTFRRIRCRFTEPQAQPPSKPTWSPGNLSKHFEKRIIRDKGCLESMIELEKGLQLTKGHYRQRSEKTFSNPALIARYRNEKSAGSGKRGEFEASRQQFTDRELMTAITSDNRKTFITCYHWHFDRYPCQGKPDSEAESGRQLLKVRRRLLDQQKWNKIKDLEFLGS